MEPRKIIIVDSSSNQKVVLNTDATTFGELKRAARAAGINYEGKDWLEGITQNVPVSDDSLLPVNVRYTPKTGPNAGQEVITNNLAYMLTDTNKKIKSGFDRKSLYLTVKNDNLADWIRSTYHKSYTNMTNKELYDAISASTGNSKNNAKPSNNINVVASYEDLIINGLIINEFAVFLSKLPESLVRNIVDKSYEIRTKNTVSNIEFTDSELDEIFNA